MPSSDWNADQLHPDDRILFDEMEALAHRLAAMIGEVLHGFEPKTPAWPGSPVGKCYGDGRITILFRHRNRMEDGGEWCTDRFLLQDIRQTVAHEVAHLRYMDHSPEFRALEAQLIAVLDSENAERPHQRESILTKIKKLHQQAINAKEIGSDEEAAAFAAKVQQLLLRYQIDIADLNDVDMTKPENYVIEEERIDWSEIGLNTKARKRTLWLSDLARAVAEAHNCQTLIQTGTNNVWLVGTEASRAVSGFLILMLATHAKKSLERAYRQERKRLLEECGDTYNLKGFRRSFLNGYVSRIRSRLREMREALEREEQARADAREAELSANMRAASAPTPSAAQSGSSETEEPQTVATEDGGEKVVARGLVVLDAEEQATKDYVEAKYKPLRRNYRRTSAFNRHGHNAGSAAGGAVSLATNTVSSGGSTRHIGG